MLASRIFGLKTFMKLEGGWVEQENENIYHPIDWNPLPSITRRAEV